MSLDVGAKLDRYEIRGTLGAGGMGEVYRAWDPRLEREVAVKVLPVSVTGNANAMARFEREARLVAALAHPNILAIYDFGTTDDGLTYAAMELIDGETLRERLAAGPLPARKAVAIGRQVARALGAAHDRGLVHRDLKPDNLMITSDGQAKVLDFGLATQRDDTAGASASSAAPIDRTRTSLTTPGTVMGTVGYMAPEQVRGGEADHRSDIFAFGCVLYEMLTGRRAFQRETAAETMTAILREEPAEPDVSGTAVPPALDRVVRRCLEKSPDERFQSARDLAFAIDNALSASGGAPLPAATDEAAPRAPRRPVLLIAAVAVLGVAAGLAVGWGLRPGASGDPVQVRVLTVSGSDTDADASPDGKLIAFASARDGRSRIWLRQLEGGGEQPLTDGPDTSPRFAPDGSTVAFLRDDGGVVSVYRQALVGGQPRRMVKDAQEVAWSPDATRIAILRTAVEDGAAIRGTRLLVVDAQDGSERELTTSDRLLQGLAWSPDGRRIVSAEASLTGNNADYRLVLVDVDDGTAERRTLPSAGMPISAPNWVARGGLIYAVASSLVGDQGDTLSRIVRYDPGADVETTLFWSQYLFPLQGMRSDFTRIDVVRPGTLVFHQVRIRQVLVEEPLDGKAGMVPRRLTRSEGRDRQPVYSPDGTRLMFSSNRSGNLDLWTVDSAGGAPRQITDDSAQDWDPAFTPDGEHILWSSDRDGHMEIWMANVDGSAARRVSDDGVDAENPTMTADGQWIVYWSANQEKAGVWKIRPDGSEATRLAEGTFMQPEVSPDGRSSLFLRLDNDVLRTRIFVVDLTTSQLVPFHIDVPAPLRGSGGVILGRARWLPDGSAIAFVGIDERGRSGIFRQDFVPGHDTAATRRPLAGFRDDSIAESFGIAPDGTRIAIASMERTFQLMRADDVPLVAPAR